MPRLSKLETEVALSIFSVHELLSHSCDASPHRSARPSKPTRYTGPLSLSAVWPFQCAVTTNWPTLSPSGAIPKQNPPKCHEPLLVKDTAALKAGFSFWNWAAVSTEARANSTSASDIAKHQRCQRLTKASEGVFYFTPWAILSP